MKVCFVIPSYTFFLSHRLRLVQELAKHYDVTVLTDLNSGNFEAKPQSDQLFELKHLSKRKSLDPLSAYKHIRALNSSIKEINPKNIFFVTLEASLFGAILTRKIKRLKVNFIISGIGPFYFSKIFKYKLYKKIVKLIFKFIVNKKNSSFIFQNNDDKEFFISERIINPSQSMVIHGNGIKIPETVLSKKGVINIVRFCFIGRLAISKGIEEFVEAFKIVKSKYVHVECFIAGSFDAGASDYLSHYDYQKIFEHHDLNYIGEIDHENVDRVYKLGDVFVLPSDREGLPKAALEAAAVGIPLILSNVPGCRECISNNGYLVQKSNVTELASKMEAFVTNKDLIKNMGKNSRELVTKKFSIEKIASDYMKIIS